VSVTGLLDQITGVGTDRRRGGYSRHGFDSAERELREWFTEQASRRGLDVTADRCGNLLAWWGAPGPDAVVTGSHLDSVPGGGAFDGPLGVASALSAVDILRERGLRPRRPFAVAVFVEEEGGRFGLPCLGSRLLTGGVEPETALALRDSGGVTLAEAMAAAGFDPAVVGRDDEVLCRIGRFVELHVEQGRLLSTMTGPVAVASSLLAHGRWRFTVTGQGNHAGTTEVRDRHDPMLPAATAVLAARRLVLDLGAAMATIGRLVPTPGGTNVIPSTVDSWLDARSASTRETMSLVERIVTVAREAAEEEGCLLSVREESCSDSVVLDPVMRDELAGLLGDVPLIPTGAGHDAGVLAASVPTAMLFVRNPSGVSHAPEEHAEPADCEAGAAALATVLERLSR
jgi:beta-ureidopropionase / N-carbamoyl-L-amino-acid hydrolase